MTDRNQILLAIALLIVLAIVGFIIGKQIPPRVDLPFDTGSTVLAVQFAHLPEEVNNVFGAAHRYAPEIRRAQYLDFVFIAGYVALFVLTGLTLRRYDIPAPRLAAWLAVGCAVAGGAFDVAENIAILKLAANPNVITSDVRFLSLPKWGLISLVLIVESAVFFFWPRLAMWWRLAAVVVGAMFLGAGGASLLFTLLVSVRDLATAADWISYALLAMLLFLCAIYGLRRKRA